MISDTLTKRFIIMSELSPEQVQRIHDLDMRLDNEYATAVKKGDDYLTLASWHYYVFEFYRAQVNRQQWDKGVTVAEQHLEIERFADACENAIFKKLLPEVSRDIQGPARSEFVRNQIKNWISDVDFTHRLDRIIREACVTLNRSSATSRRGKEILEKYG